MSGYHVALAGSPNVGKSTLFNALTGLHQHTGNWAGKTVASAQGTFRAGKTAIHITDTPGAYSLFARSPEEAVTRDALYFGNFDCTVVVCDAACLTRNLLLVLQAMEFSRRVVVCVNLMDEAQKKGITPDLTLLSSRLGVPVIGITARKKHYVKAFAKLLVQTLEQKPMQPFSLPLQKEVSDALHRIQAALSDIPSQKRTVFAKPLLADDTFLQSFLQNTTVDAAALTAAIQITRRELSQKGITIDHLQEAQASALHHHIEKILQGVISTQQVYAAQDRRLDRILTGRFSAYPFMLILLCLMLYLTIQGANAPSQWLSRCLFALQDHLSILLSPVLPKFLHDILIFGMYRTLAWVVSVMLPPMAIFFPLFTLLEDAGYLPRIAYNLDRPFAACGACGKQALCMCMGLGCNAVGITGCRIIDSKRERLLAILTNVFMPCNGRFPTLIALISIFFVGTKRAFPAALYLTGLLVFCVLITLAVTYLLSKTILRGIPSAFTLEMPSYRTPQIGRVLVRSMLDRTLFVLGRAAAIAAPAGIVLYLLANVHIGGASILTHAASFLDPFARLFSMDGVILLAFILALPANEIFIPIMLMGYLNLGILQEYTSLGALGQTLSAAGWTPVTALCVCIFCICHFPCSTTLLTIKKETGSWGWTLLCALLPTTIGFSLCLLLSTVASFL